MNPDVMITHLVGASALIVLVAHLAGWAARRVGQPYIVGQLVAGIALGPSLLGEISPSLRATVFPPAIAPVLSGLSQISLVLFLFAVGYELDLRVLRGRTRAAFGVSIASFAVPMAAGCGGALIFQRQLHALGMPRHLPVASVLFLGVALSITAVPVLTAIVRENGLSRTVPGVIAVSAAGMLDVLGWTVLAGTMLPTAPDGALSWQVRLGLAVAFVTAMLLGGRRLLLATLWRIQLDPSLRLALLVGFALASAWVTNALGLHVIFGALLAGVVVPRERGGTLDADLVRPLNEISSLLLPFFFVVSGQAVAVGGLDGAGLVTLVAVTVLGMAVKIGSGTVTARLSGLDKHDARTVGVLLSTRGLTELIALSAGLQAGLLSRRLYTILVFMALATTLLTQPLLKLVRRLRLRERGAEADGPQEPLPVPEAPAAGSGEPAAGTG
ncbi:cation:proton antiporter [Streptomyces sp. NBC_00370]|uniref:cation:proton antiporter n=1 Tax=Streptomyces sp. NBC_00370 TaxID=2975728 RepID=UPI002E257929